MRSVENLTNKAERSAADTYGVTCALLALVAVQIEISHQLTQLAVLMKKREERELNANP